MMGEGAHGRILKKVEQRDLVARLVTKFIMNLDHEKRMSAEIEEAVVKSHALEAEGFRPDRGQLPLEFVAVSGLEAGSLFWSGLGSARRSSLPFGVLGNSARKSTAEGTTALGSFVPSHCCTSAAAGAGAALAMA